MSMLKAVLFDMNGVLIDDEDLQMHAWKQFLDMHRIHLSIDEVREVALGKLERDALRHIFNEGLSNHELQALLNERLDIAEAMIDRQLTIPDGLHDLLEDINTAEIVMGVATGAQSRNYNFVMGKFNIGSYFAARLTADDIMKGKPDPEVYLKLAEELHVAPDECVVFEDSHSGIEAAHAAGMKVVGLASTHRLTDLPEVELKINSFSEITVQQLQALLA